MSRVSISRAWDETKAVIGRDGRLLAAVSLALIALPSTISTLIDPESGMGENGGTLASALVVLAMSVVAMVGQLALIRLAIGPSVSVGGAIGHAARRAPVYLGSVILIILGLLLLAVPIIAVLTAMGITVEEGTPPSGAAWAAILLFIVVAVFVGTRMLMTSSVASAENAGPVQILKRSWALTRGNTGRLLGFLLMFMVALVVVLSVIGVMIGLLSAALLGKAQPFSLAALLVGLVQGVATAAATVIFAVMLARIYLQLAGDPAAEVSVPSSGGD